MIQLLKAIVDLIAEYIPLIGSLALVTTLTLLLHRSIKRHAKGYYYFFGAIAFIALVNTFLPMLGVHSDPRALFKIPILGTILRQFVHIYGISFPLLILIMYMGALSTKNKAVAKLMSIRKELSIMVGFPVIVHATTRILHITPSNLKYIFKGESFGQLHGEPIGATSELLMQIAFFIGLFLATLLLILWITSFPAIHRRLGAKRWKNIQRWSYLFYALLFCHSTLLRTSWTINALENGDSALPDLIALATTLLIFSSYLILRLRKAHLDRLRKEKRSK